MQTEVIMKREIWGSEVSQKSKSEFFSATDLVRAGNKYRIANGKSLFDLSDWLANKRTKEFISSLEKKYGTVKISGNGRGNHTWVHPFLFIDIALAISPELKIEVYGWLYDHLLKYRNESGDSYKKMCGSIATVVKNSRELPDVLSKIAKRIQFECCVTDWQNANELQLKLRDRIQENISLLTDILRDINQAVTFGIKKAKEIK